MIKLNFENQGYKIINKNPFNLERTFFDKNFNLLYEKYRNNNWENVAVLNEKQLIEHDVIKQIFLKILKIFNHNKINNLYFDNLWLVQNSKKFYKKNELPYIPHIDKKRSLKVMIYLCDVDILNGPLFLHSDNPQKYEKLRLSLPHDYKLKKLNVLSNLSYENFIYCTGDFGTTIFFDTNTPHFAGKIEELKVRNILRFNFRYY